MFEKAIWGLNVAYFIPEAEGENQTSSSESLRSKLCFSLVLYPSLRLHSDIWIVTVMQLQYFILTSLDT